MMRCEHKVIKRNKPQSLKAHRRLRKVMENLTKRVFQLARSCELAHGGWVRANINQTWALNNPQLF